MPDRGPAVGGAPLIEARELDLRLGGKEILSHVSLSVQAGEIVTLVGPNGAGKSTLVRVLLGLLKPDKGSVHLRPGTTIGYVPQQLAVDPVLPLSVRRLLQLPHRHDAAKLRAALDEVGADYLLDRQVTALSGGELRRVLLARALLRDADLLVLDEPLQQIDFAGQIGLFRLIAELRQRRGCGVLLVSHDLYLVMAGTDRVLCLNGHICCSGAPESVSRHPEFTALFGPRAAEALAVYSHAHDHRHDLHGEVVPLPHSHGHGETAEGGGP